MSVKDYSDLDQPQVLGHLFHPRPDTGMRQPKENREDIMISVEKDIHVGASFHFAAKDAPFILFFHGNGEIVSDYDDLGLLFNEKGLNFFVADYRGYGSSKGSPSVSTMIKDAHAIFDFTLSYMTEKELSGPLCVMGRSLGSASALEIADEREKDFNALIIESGFALMKPLLRKLGVFFKDTTSYQSDGMGSDGMGSDGVGLENIDKIKNFSKPCLVIHAQFDHIIPFTDGQALFDGCPSENKTLLEIKGANHNDIFLRGMEPYLEHLQKICKRQD